jgi:hypothetical protein
MNGALLQLYRHKTWATLRLIEYCQALDDEHLDATIPGTYGTIRNTLRTKPKKKLMAPRANGLRIGARAEKVNQATSAVVTR